jgi:hypothetical protein
MPQLIKGRMIFTDEDYVIQDFEDAVQMTHTQPQTQRSLVINLKDEIKRLNIMTRDKKENYASLYESIYMETLQQALINIVALAQKEGYTLMDMLK